MLHTTHSFIHSHNKMIYMIRHYSCQIPPKARNCIPILYVLCNNDRVLVILVWNYVVFMSYLKLWSAHITVPVIVLISNQDNLADLPMTSIKYFGRCHISNIILHDWDYSLCSDGVFIKHNTNQVISFWTIICWKK